MTDKTKRYIGLTLSYIISVIIVWAILLGIVKIAESFKRDPNAPQPPVTYQYKVTEYLEGIGEYGKVRYFSADDIRVIESDNCLSLTQGMRIIYAHCGKVTIELVSQ